MSAQPSTHNYCNQMFAPLRMPWRSSGSSNDAGETPASALVPTTRLGSNFLFRTARAPEQMCSPDPHHNPHLSWATRMRRSAASLTAGSASTAGSTPGCSRSMGATPPASPSPFRSTGVAGPRRESPSRQRGRRYRDFLTLRESRSQKTPSPPRPTCSSAAAIS